MTPQRARFVFICVLALASLLTTEDVEAVQVTPDGKAVWRVTFKYRLPDQPPGLYETRIVELDAQTGKITGASIN